MLHETVANEMDPNLIVIRLGPALSKERMSDKSAPVNSVNDGDIFAVSFHRDNFNKKRDAQMFSRLNRDTCKDFFS